MPYVEYPWWEKIPIALAMHVVRPSSLPVCICSHLHDGPCPVCDCYVFESENHTADVPQVVS